MLVVWALAATSACSAKKARTATSSDAGLAPVTTLRPSGKPIALPPEFKAPGVNVALIQPGAEPRRVLRYTPKVGASQTIRLTASYGFSLNSGEHKMFSREQRDTAKLTLTVTKIAPNGNVHLELRVREIESRLVGPVFDKQPKQRAFDGTAVIDNRGNLLASDIPGLENNEHKRDLLNLHDYFVPLPAEPVGVGARWRLRYSAVRNAMTVDSTDVLTVTAVNGNTVTANMRNRQRIRPQMMTNTKIGSLVIIESDRMDASGSGTATLQLDQPAFTTITTKFGASASMRNRFPSRVMDMTFKMKADIRMEPQ